MELKYSIIIPHYNCPTLLYKLIESIPARDDIEIIVIDDNSKHFLNLSSFINYNISLFINGTGIQSAGACRNIGLKKATGKWILFADSDDYFLPSAFDTFDRYINSNWDVIFFSPISIDLNTGLVSDRHIYFQKLVRRFINKESDQIKYSFSVPWSKLISNNFLKKHCFRFDEVIASNDIMFSLKVGSMANSIKAIDTNVYCVTNRSGSLVTLRNKDTLRARFMASMRRNKLLHELHVGFYQESFFSLLKKYYKVLLVKDLRTLLQLVISRKLIVIPNRFNKKLPNNTSA